MNEKKVAFVGPQEYVSLMRFMGFHCFSVTSKSRAKEKIKQLEDENYALVFVSQDVYSEEVCSDRVVVLPGILKEADESFLKEEITKAIGGEMDL